MNRIAKLLFSSPLAVALNTGCYGGSSYSGDGHLTDNGPLAATDRYVLDLGPIDLTQPGKKHFRIANLPEVNFVVGVEISVAPQDQVVVEKQLINSVLSLELSESAGETLVAKKAALNTWTWSVPAEGHQAFIYGREKQATYFNARAKTKYVLTLNVLEPDRSQSKYSSQLKMKSGGWK